MEDITKVVKKVRKLFPDTPSDVYIPKNLHESQVAKKKAQLLAARNKDEKELAVVDVPTGSTLAEQNEKGEEVSKLQEEGKDVLAEADTDIVNKGAARQASKKRKVAEAE